MPDIPPVGVLLTAGRATRLRPLSDHFPKSLVPLLNRPLFEYALDVFRRIGVTRLAVVVSPGDRATPAALQAVTDIEIHVCVQAEPRGTGDAVLAAAEWVGDGPLVVLPVDAVLIGDVTSPVRAFLEGDFVAGLVLTTMPDPRPFGVALLEGDRIVHLEEKPEHPRSNVVNASPWLLRSPVLARLRAAPVINARDEVDLIATVALMVEEGTLVGGWMLDGELIDVGTLPGLLAGQSRLLAACDPPQQVSSSARVEGTRLEGHVLIGPGAQVRGGLLADTVVGADATLEHATLHRALVSPGSRVVGLSAQDVIITPDGRVVPAGF